jgi:tetratricopeptide (TPR) repeat protein
LNRNQAAQWAKQFGQHPSVLLALADARWEPAETDARLEYLTAFVRLSPDYAGYRKLAEIYKGKQDLQQWKAVLDEFLATPSYGLEHARVRVDIARHFMQSKQWEVALPYAEAAAQTYAEWAMLCAFECHEALGQLEQAQLWFGRVAQRYPGHTERYAAWCRKHGLEAPKSVDQLDGEQLETLAAKMPAEKRFMVGGQLLASGDAQRALRVFQTALEDVKDARSRCYNGLFVAVLADELGKSSLRDAALESVAAEKDPAQAGSQRLAALLKKCVAGGQQAALDVKAVEDLLAKASLEDQVNLGFFVGRFLDSRGQAQEARKHYERSAKIEGAEGYLTRQLARLAVEEP